MKSFLPKCINYRKTMKIEGRNEKERERERTMASTKFLQRCKLSGKFFIVSGSIGVQSIPLPHNYTPSIYPFSQKNLLLLYPFLIHPNIITFFLSRKLNFFWDFSPIWWLSFDLNYVNCFVWEREVECGDYVHNMGLIRGLREIFWN